MLKTILIAGASKGLGQYLFDELKLNYKMLGISKKKNKNLYQLDLINEKKTLDFFKRLKKKKISLDTIIFCVGYSNSNKESSNEWKKILDLNLISFVNLLNSYSSAYKNKPIRFIVVSSIAGLKNIGAPTTYSVAKSALNFYCQIKAKELAKFGVVINLISPGNILQKNNLWDKKIIKNKKNIFKYINNNVPLKNFIYPKTILEICNFLINIKINQVTGSNFILDGGQIL
jgi:3-oxoacyl-[acyl-carrier protein] reductase